MTPTRAATLVAIAASLGLATLTPAMAEGPRAHREDRAARTMDFRAGAGGRFELAQFSCAPKAAQRMESRYDRLAQRLKLTTEQHKLYDTFVASALTAQTNLADKCATLQPKPAASADAKASAKPVPDLVVGIENRIKIDEARLEAMNTVLPDFRAFYSGLTDEQKASFFNSDRGPRGFRGFHQRFGR